MMAKYYILEDREPKVVDFNTWARWLGNTEQRIVQREHVGKYLVSTVFLGLDHSFGYGRPLLFETCIFGPEHKSEVADRCSTYAEAELMHKRACARLQPA